MDSIPKFLKVRGCINCDISKRHKEETGKDYGFDHELMAACVLLNCQTYGFSLSTPFIDPSEYLAVCIKHMKTEEHRQNVLGRLENIKEKFGRYYDSINVSLDNITKEIESLPLP